MKVESIYLCSSCLAYQVPEKGAACGRCSVNQLAKTDADSGATVTLLFYAAIVVGAIVFLVATFPII